MKKVLSIPYFTEPEEQSKYYMLAKNEIYL